MKKLCLFIFIVAMFVNQGSIQAQILGQPGATWVFSSTGIWAVCFEVNEKWEYMQDTSILGVGVKDIRLTRKTLYPPPFPGVTTWVGHSYFHLNGDTAWLFVNADSTWQEVYNFSLQTGDSTMNPLANKLNSFATWCADSVPYNQKSVVVDHGNTNIDGQSLRYYTIKYHKDNDTAMAYQTFIERVITLNYWHPNDEYWCGAIVECTSPTFMCYKDNGMITDSLCSDLIWFETLSFNEEGNVDFKIYPNPVSDVLTVQTNISGINDYEILSVDGKIILKNVHQWVDVSFLPSGIYYITNKNRTVFRKFIKL